ncbi:MAG: hypothetical protein HKO53_02045 [Gemmatimonadetes bacterium]|nr:hypothetical protein [Gemmatimonadota bacterium]
MAVLALMGFAGGGSGQEVAPPDNPEATEAIGKIRSPFCPGLMLEICPTAQAEALRDSIQAMAETGLTADSVVELVVAQYGEEYRAYPKRSGAGLVAWIVPPLALVLGLGAVILVLRHLREPESQTVHEGLSDQDEERIREAMAAMEEDV